MTPRFFVAAFAALLPVAALAQGGAPPIETVTVNASALVGVWKVDVPAYGSVNFSFHTTWGPMQGNFCRIEQAQNGLSANCFPGPGREGKVTVEESHFHMAWGTMMARAYIDASMSSPTAFDGHIGVKLSGLAIENPASSHGEKMILSAIKSDPGGKGPLLTRLLTALSGGTSDNGAIDKAPLVQLPTAAELRELGALDSVIYLGASPKPLPPNAKEPAQPEFYRVYDVEFAAGHRLCGLHQRDDGMVDALRCV